MALSEEAERSYVKRGGVKCLYCGSRNIEDGVPQTYDQNTITMPVVCLQCRGKYIEVYKLTGIDEIEEGLVSYQVARKHRA